MQSSLRPTSASAHKDVSSLPVLSSLKLHPTGGLERWLCVASSACVDSLATATSLPSLRTHTCLCVTLPASIWACACPCLSSACPVWFILGGGALITPFWSIWLKNKRNCTIALYTSVKEREKWDTGGLRTWTHTHRSGPGMCALLLLLKLIY